MVHSKVLHLFGASIHLIPEVFYVVYLILFKRAFGNAILYFVPVVTLV